MKSDADTTQQLMSFGLSLYQARALQLRANTTGEPETVLVSRGVEMLLRSIAGQALKGSHICPGCGEFRDGWPTEWRNVPTEPRGVRYCCSECVARVKLQQ